MTERELFMAVLDVDDLALRAALLDRECEADPGLRDRVAALLQAHNASGQFMDGPAGGSSITLPTPSANLVGQRIGPYKLLQVIGEGGFGVVYMAEQERPISRRVALKVIKPGMDSALVLARFEAERQALAMMDHPNIAKVLDAGVTNDGHPYFVMELVKGVPVTEFCDANHMPAAERLRLFIAICNAVQHAHQKGVIHRDIKPSNILVTLHDGVPVPKVIDFGVAKATAQKLTEKTLFTAYGQMIGTPAYMSPEQAEMSGLDIDTRSDIYSLGVLLFELLTGTTPIDGMRFRQAGYVEMQRLIREEEAPRPSVRLSSLGETATILAKNRGTDARQLAKQLTGDLDWIVLKSVSKDRNRRYGSAGAFAEDVERFLRHEPILARPPSIAYRLRKLGRRHRGPVVAGSIILLALVCGIIGTTWGLLRANSAWGVAEQEAEEKGLALGEKEVALADAEDKLFQAILNRATAERRRGRVGQRFAALKAIQEAAKIRVTAELRNEAMAALVLPDIEAVHEWPAWPADTLDVDFDAAYERYAHLDKRGGVAICRRTEGGEQVLAKFPPYGNPPFSDIWMSPDGQTAAFGHSCWLGGGEAQEVRVVNLSNTGVTNTFVIPNGMNERALAFRWDRRQVAVGHGNGQVTVYSLHTGEAVRRFAVGGSPRQLSFSPNSGRLAVVERGAIRQFEVDSGQEVTGPRPFGLGRQVYHAAWHPDGRRVAGACGDGFVRIWDSQTGEEVVSPIDESTEGLSLTFAAAGDAMVAHGWHGESRVYEPRTGRFHLGVPWHMVTRYRPMGRLLGYGVAGDRIRLWQFSAGREVQVFRRPRRRLPDPQNYAVIEPSGRVLAASTSDSLNFFDAMTGEELATVRSAHFNGLIPAYFEPPSGAAATGLHGAWITGGRGHVYRWPTGWDRERPNVLRVGPPEAIVADSGAGYSAGVRASADGRIMAVPQINSTLILDRDRPEKRFDVPLPDARSNGVSPNGKWVVAASH